MVFFYFYPHSKYFLNRVGNFEVNKTMNLLWKNKNFLILFLGRVITNIGDSLYYVAAMWLIYQLGGSSLYSGIAGFLILLPASLQFLTGPLVDRWSLKKILVSTQLLQFILIIFIPISYYLDFLTVELILVVVPLATLISQFENPSERKALPMTIDKADLVKGNSLFSFAYQGVDMIFNAIGGVLVASISAIALFIGDSFTFIITAGLFSLLKLHPNAQRSECKKGKSFRMGTVKTYVTELKEGFSIVFHSLLAVFLLGSIICNFALGAAMAILPSFAEYKGGADIYGLLLAAESTGILLGSFSATWIGRFKVGQFSIIAFTIGSLCWVSASLVPWVSATIILFGIAWIPIGATNVLLGAVQQSVIPEYILARVSSVTYSMSAIAMPIGSLLGGYLASLVGSNIIFAVSGSGLLLISIVWTAYPKLRKLPRSNDMTAATFNIPEAHYKEARL